MSHDDKPDIRCEWEAWYNRQPGAHDPKLRVLGRCKLPSGSIQIKLERGNEGIVDEPDLLVLEATVEIPAGGTDDFVEREVLWEGDAGPGIERVRIQGDLSAEVDVRDAD